MDWRSPVGIHMIVIGAVFAYLMVFLRDALLPEKYSRDSRQLEIFVASTPAKLEGSPFGKTADVFRALSIFGGPEFVGLVSVTLFLILVLKCIPVGAPKLWHAATLTASLALAGIYLTAYSKDFFVIPLVLLFIYLGQGIKWEILWLGVALAYAYQLRANWFLVAGLYVYMRFALKLARRRLHLVGLLILLIVLLSAAFQFALGVPLHSHRYDVVESLGADINTRIVDPFPMRGFGGDVINGIYSMVIFLFPAVLIIMGNPIYILAGGFIGVSWVITFRKLGKGLREHDSQTVMYWRVIALLLASTVVQSLYAPDWGAYLRHMAPLIPLFALAHGGALSRPCPDRLQIHASGTVGSKLLSGGRFV
jgi:hypothetical protein